MKKCPYCAEEIQDEAVLCRYCGKDLAPVVIAPADPRTNENDPKKDSNRGAIVGTLLALLLLLVVGFVVMQGLNSARSKPRPTTGPNSFGAWDVCKQYIEKSLKAPTTAKWPRYDSGKVMHLTGNAYSVMMDVDAQNSFGAMIRSTFICRAEWQYGETWKITDLRTQ